MREPYKAAERAGGGQSSASRDGQGEHMPNHRVEQICNYLSFANVPPSLLRIDPEIT